LNEEHKANSPSSKVEPEIWADQVAKNGRWFWRISVNGIYREDQDGSPTKAMALARGTEEAKKLASGA